MLYAIGIDPGLKGSISILCLGKETEVIETINMPLWKDGYSNTTEVDGLKLREFFYKWKEERIIIAIEKQQVIASQGICSAFTNGQNVGIIRGVCEGMRLPYKLISPKVWQGYYDFPVTMSKNLETSNIKDSKKRNIAVCQHLFPQIELCTKRGRWKDEIADSILIANWALHS